MENFIVRPEHILMGFLKAFFSQEKLFSGVPNEFIYTDGSETKSLIIETSEDFDMETVGSIPSLVIQEGGSYEEYRAIDNRNWHKQNTESHINTFVHSYTVHCLARNKGSTKLLQASCAKSLITFRKSIYELGVDYISPLQNGPPQKMNSQMENVPGPFDCTISFQMRMQQDWMLSRTGDPEESVKISVGSALEAIEYDENGDPTFPPEEWFSQNISIQL